MSWMPILSFPISTRYLWLLFCHAFYRWDLNTVCILLVLMIYWLFVESGRFLKNAMNVYWRTAVVSQSLIPSMDFVNVMAFAFDLPTFNLFLFLMLWQGAAEDSEAKSEELNRVVEELHKLLKDAGEGTRLLLIGGNVCCMISDLLLSTFSHHSQQGSWGKVAGDELQHRQECDGVKRKNPSPWERAWQCQWVAFKF